MQEMEFLGLGKMTDIMNAIAAGLVEENLPTGGSILTQICEGSRGYPWLASQVLDNCKAADHQGCVLLQARGSAMLACLTSLQARPISPC